MFYNASGDSSFSLTWHMRVFISIACVFQSVTWYRIYIEYAILLKTYSTIDNSMVLYQICDF